MSDTVVDSSVVAKWILPEADSAEAQLFVFESAQRNERSARVGANPAVRPNMKSSRSYRGSLLTPLAFF